MGASVLAVLTYRELETAYEAAQANIAEQVQRKEALALAAVASHLGLRFSIYYKNLKKSEAKLFLKNR